MYVKTSSDGVAVPRLNAILSSLQAADGAHAESALRKRQYYPYGYGNYGYSGWNGYGRWIVLGVVVGLALLIWLSVCFCNRRRTRAGAKPVKYTGWATPGFQHPQQTGVTNQYNTQPYSAPQQNTQYPMQNYTQYPQTSQYPQTNTYAPQQSYPQGGYSEYNQPPSYPAAPAPVAGREK